jgi:aconitate hydratase
MLRKKGVVGKFVEFFGPGLASCPARRPRHDREHGPEYGATMGFFPVDGETLTTSSSPAAKAQVELVEAY